MKRLIDARHVLLAWVLLAMASPPAAADHGPTPGFARIWHKNVAGVPGASAAGEHYGFAVAAGDFNCDGFDDLAIGIPYQDKQVLEFTLPEAGAIQVLYGGAGGLSTRDSQLISSPRGGSGHFGHALAAEPFGTEPCRNLLVGAPGLDADAGRVFRYQATTGGLMLTSSEGIRLDDYGVASAAGDRFGHAIHASEPRADGGRHVAIGAPGRTVASHAEAGAVLAMMLGALSPDHVLFLTENSGQVGTVAEPGDRFGDAVLWHDDNGDAIPDLVVGKPFEDLAGLTANGQVAILYSGPDSLATSRIHIDADDFPGAGMGSLMFFGSRLAARPSASGQSPQLAIGSLGTWNGVPGAGVVHLRTNIGGAGETPDHLHAVLDADNFGVAGSFDHLGHGLAYVLRGGGTGGYHADYLLLGLPGEGGDIGAVGIRSSNFYTTADYPVFDQAHLFSSGWNEPGDRFGEAIASGDFNGRGGYEAVAAMPSEDVGFVADAGALLELSWDFEYDAPLFADGFEDYEPR